MKIIVQDPFSIKSFNFWRFWFVQIPEQGGYELIPYAHKCILIWN